MANKRTVVQFGAIPGVVFQAPLPNARGEAVPYSQMRVGSDDTLFLAAPSKGEIEVEHDEHMPHYQVVALAYRMLLKAVLNETWAEFNACRQRIMDEQRDPTSL